MICEDLRKKVDQADVVAFDVFDTLLVRPFLRPTDLFYFLERSFSKTGFASARVKAESDARVKYIREANYDEVYSLLPQFSDMKDIEVWAEIDLCMADPEITGIWEYARASGKMVVAISEMYLPPEVISKMLAKCGFTGYDRLYVSCEHRVGKSDGELYRKVLGDLGMPASSMLMIGNDPYKDVKAPSSLGCYTYRWKPLVERYGEKHRNEVRFGRKGPEESFVVGMDMLMEIPEDEGYWHMLGRRFAGPLATMFAQFVEKSSGDVDKLFFFSRDGYLAKKAYEALGGTKPCEYVYTSRMLAHVLTEGRIKVEWHPQVYLFLKSVGEAERLGLTGSKDVVEHMDDILPVLERYRENYRAYLKRCAGDAGKVMFVDTTTMRYTSQKNIAGLLGGVDCIGCYYAVTNHEDVPHIQYADRSKEHLVWSYVNLTEMFLSSPEPPLRTVIDGEPQFESDVGDYERERISHCPELEDGVLGYVSYFKESVGKYGFIVDYLVIDGWLKVLMRNDDPSVPGSVRSIKWPTGPTNTEFVYLVFRPRNLYFVAKCKAAEIYYNVKYK